MTNIKLIDYDPVRYLETQEDIDGYLQAAYDTGDSQLFIHALSDAARAKGMLKVSQATGLNRGNLYRSLSRGEKTSFQTVTKIMNYLGYQLTLTRKGSNQGICV